MEKVVERFLKYVAYDTKSNPENSDKVKPSSKGQWDLAE